MKRWEVRGGVLLRVSFATADIELRKAETHGRYSFEKLNHTADTQDDSLRHDSTLMPALLAHTHQPERSIPRLAQHSQQNGRVTSPVQLCRTQRASSPSPQRHELTGKD